MQVGASVGCGRTAPSTTGFPHPGTVASALLAWLDARHRGQRFFVRLENLDAGRTRPAYVTALRGLFAWLQLECDAVQLQSAHVQRHAAALDGLADRGLLYACCCSRQRLARLPGAGGDIGTAAYDGHCRTPELRALTRAGWRASPATVRLALADVGDPIVRRRDGSIGYALAVVLDDAAEGVTHIVRGQDLAAHVPLHRQMYTTLGRAPPVWLHHPLLYGALPGKLSKSLDSAPIDPGSPPYAPTWLLGQLGYLLNLVPTPAPVTAAELLACYSWDKLPPATQPLLWAPAEQG